MSASGGASWEQGTIGGGQPAPTTAADVADLAKDGKLLDALALARQALDSKTGDRAGLQLELADVYDTMGYVDDQVAVLEAIIAEQTEELVAGLSTSSSAETLVATAKIKLGHVLVSGRGAHREALRLYGEAAKSQMNSRALSMQALWMQGCVLGLLGEQDDASRSFAQALQVAKLKPDIFSVPDIFNVLLALRVGAAASNKSVYEHTRAYADPITASLAAQDLPPFMDSSWNYVRSRPGFVASSRWVYAFTYDMLQLAMGAARVDGLVLECGVFHGNSIRMIAAHWPDVPVHGFDTFEGLPEQWYLEPAGTYSAQGTLPKAPGNVQFHKGLFSDSLSPFLSTHPGPLRFLNVDCDLYSSTWDIFRAVHDRVVPGTVIAFDEYVMYPNWEKDEFAAFQEAAAEYGWSYEYLGVSFVSKQAVVRIVEGTRASGSFAAA